MYCRAGQSSWTAFASLIKRQMVGQVVHAVRKGQHPVPVPEPEYPWTRVPCPVGRLLVGREINDRLECADKRQVKSGTQIK